MWRECPNLAATVVEVSAPTGWGILNFDYDAWANKQGFKVGYTIVFTYNPLHNVVWLDAASYTSCVVTNYFSIDDSGETRFTFSASGDYHFTSSKLNDCLSLVKMTVHVL